MEQTPTVGMRKGEYGALSIVRRVIQVASHLPVLQALLVTSVNTNHNKFRVHCQLSIILLHLACNKGKTSLYIKIGVCFILVVTMPKPSQTVGHSLRFWYSWKALDKVVYMFIISQFSDQWNKSY
jgi:hypothetical protein